MTTLRRGSRTSSDNLHMSDVQFRELLDSLPAAAYTCSADGLITYFNRRAVELWGREPLLNDERDRYCGSFRLFEPGGAPIAHEQCWMALAIRDNRGYNAEEIVIERQDGARRTVLAHANPLHDGRGRVTGAVNVLVDITERKATEMMLREADRAKNEFLATLAHELRNPLSPMRNGLVMMRAAADDEQRREHAEAIVERQMEHLTRIVDDLLDIARITRNSLELRLERVRLSTVLDQAVETSRPIVELAGHRLHVADVDDDLELHADPQRLAQLFANLLSNAAKYTDAGGDIWLSTRRQGSEAVVTVRDSGIGLAAGDIDRVFDMFSRGDGSAGRSGDGLGIGLTLARRVAELHGGRIEARSDGPGRGTEFRVRLPLLVRSVGMTRSERPSRASRAAPLAPLRILVVDDNRDSAETLAELLAMDGHETHVARDGHEAVRRAAELRPDVVLLDIGLPGLSGYEAATEIRKLPGGERVALLALTGWGQAEDRRRSAAAGFDEHFVKPVDLERLAELLSSLAAASRSGSAVRPQ